MVWRTREVCGLLILDLQVGGAGNVMLHRGDGGGDGKGGVT